MIGIKRAWVQVPLNDPRLKISPCCKYPVEARTTTDSHTQLIKEASDGKAAGKVVKFDNQQAIYGQCSKCGEAWVRVRVLTQDQGTGGLPLAVVEVWDVVVDETTPMKSGIQ